MNTFYRPRDEEPLIGRIEVLDLVPKLSLRHSVEVEIVLPEETHAMRLELMRKVAANRAARMGLTLYEADL